MQNKNTENTNTNTNAEMLVCKTTQIIVMLIYLEHTSLLECSADIRYQVQLACTLYTTQPATEKAETFYHQVHDNIRETPATTNPTSKIL